MNFTALVLLHGRLAVLSVLVIPVVVVASYFFFKKMETVFESYQNQDATVSNRLQESLSGVRVVKAFARQSYEIDRFEKENWEKYRRGVRIANLHAMFWPLADILTGAQMLGGLYLGALMAINSEISVGTYVAFVGLLGGTIWPVRGMGRLVAHISTGLVSLDRVQQIIREEKEPLEDGSAVTSKRLQGALRFEDMQFRYEMPAEEQHEEEEKRTGLILHSGPASLRANREYVLQDIDFAVRPGQVIGLLGATGSGKSSLVHLLPRFYDYSGGRITLDGIELRAYPRGYLRSQIGIVQQEPFLFSTTVRNNITYGLGRDVSDAEVETAARAAAIHEVILTFPKGYNTLVGERGVTLSGGQKQRVTIARTLLKDPSILILDDAMSSVDTETDASIRDALRALMKGRTTFIIAHRLQSVMEADLILVMDAGRVVQRGTHRELVSQAGIYRRMFELQTQIEADLQQEIAAVVEAAEAKLDGLANRFVVLRP